MTPLDIYYSLLYFFTRKVKDLFKDYCVYYTVVLEPCILNIINLKSPNKKDKYTYVKDA